MSYLAKSLPKSQAELTITVPPEEYKKELLAAATRLSERAAIKGFRPGKAPYEMVKQELGELKIMEEALERVVQHTFFEAVKAEGLATIGMPKISVEKLAPGNDLIYKATVALLPKVTLADYASIKITPELKTPSDEDVNKALTNLAKMQPKETAKTEAANKEDKVVIELNMFLDKVPVEGGQAKNHQVYLAEPHYIPGLAEELVGLRAGESKEFMLKFPAEHYQKHLAGKNVDFKIKVNEVFQLEYAKIDDDFAKALGQQSLERLKELLLENLTREAQSKEDQRVEASILEQMIEKNNFEELPEVLVDSEKRKMFYELKADLDRRGVPMEQYLKDIKKTEAEVAADFTDGAVKRAQAALISREVAKQNNISVSKEELEAEVVAIKAAYPGDKTVEENVNRPEVLDTIAATVQNRKVVEWLKAKVVEGKE